MKHFNKPLLFLACILMTFNLNAQDTETNNDPQPEMGTLFKARRHASGGYGAITNKFTTINGEFANLAGVYGGWYVNHKFMVGAGAAALTNDIRVPMIDRIDGTRDLSYMYGQVGAISEYVIASNKTVHVAFSMFAGAGFSLQYERYDWHDDHEWDWEDDDAEDEDWFFVAEPGVMVEINVFKWLRFSPGVSYRATFGSDGKGLGDSAMSNISYNATLKFGRF